MATSLRTDGRGDRGVPSSRDAHPCHGACRREATEPAGRRSRPSARARSGSRSPTPPRPLRRARARPARCARSGSWPARARPPRRRAAIPSRTPLTTTSRVHPLPGSARRMGASTAATMARRHVGTGTVTPSCSSGRHSSGRGHRCEDAVEHAVGGRALELELGAQLDAMAHRRPRHRLHLIGSDEGPSGQPRPCLRRVQHHRRAAR